MAQTYPHFEVIVSDNCSPGSETDEVVQHFMKQDSRIRYVKQPLNIGMFYNFKAVFDIAKGDYFAWLADDDTRDRTFLEKCLNIFAQPNQSPNLLLVNAYSQLFLPPPSVRQTRRSALHHTQRHPTSSLVFHTSQHPDESLEREVIPSQSSSNEPLITMGEGDSQTDQGCTTLGLSPAERYYKYLSSIYTTQSAIGDLIHGVMKRETVKPFLTTQPNILGWDRLFLSALSLEGEFYTIPEVLMYSSPNGMSTMKNAKKMAHVQGIHNPLYVWKAKWVRMFFLQKLAWCSHKLSLLNKFKLSLWLWTDIVVRTIAKRMRR